MRRGLRLLAAAAALGLVASLAARGEDKSTLMTGEISRSFELASPKNTIVVAQGEGDLVRSKPARGGVKPDAQAGWGAPDLYILAVGVDNYSDVRHKLNFAVSDARDLSEAIAEAGSGFYRHVPQVIMLHDDDVTAEHLSRAFQELATKIKASDVFLFFIAGHGKTVKGDYYFLPGRIEAFTDDAINRQGFGPRRWMDWFAIISAQKSIFIFDTCESSAALRNWVRGSAEDDAAYHRLKEATGRAIFMATSDQEACVEGFHGHGVLTYTILEGLALAGDGNKDMIDMLDLKSYVEEKVPQYSRELKACRVGVCREQKPKVPVGGDDYPLVPRYPQVLARLGTGGSPAISKVPTHVVIASTDLLAQATRGADAKSQLQPGTQVTLVKTEGEWAYVAYDGKPLGYVLSNQLLQLKTPRGPRP